MVGSEQKEEQAATIVMRNAAEGRLESCARKARRAVRRCGEAVGE